MTPADLAQLRIYTIVFLFVFLSGLSSLRITRRQVKEGKKRPEDQKTMTIILYVIAACYAALVLLKSPFFLRAR
ncbi:MAG: hypothetical protein COV74_03990 [Candidatus Omnitrophica bacterium CG11_big_fil_rev_8_21_14_0_20_45_26]|uniref:Uncharacterized protein n=1 Tax=Candidatus Abzuiibacterium crystallinum TaxID=1974748 RepID=A0A2H0LSI6_9BACT|nr:MAG: hypothetical protein COV74_03990 [Candidatus Omnitrophica bacterium CG11_big_fil_rev_8_21_14_0_20_45_26]PIW63287.1 MAG: hypothetical protein COW12_10950 [Candidatus Omnitrophica bacterium CG12_big_fil_rev_8_21_14_0_65_45_16]